MVPKRIRWTGWTLNFAHPRAYLLLIAIIAVATVPTLLTVQLGGTAALPFFGAMSFSIAGVFWMTRFFSRMPS
jgi:hypothetical protein